MVEEFFVSTAEIVQPRLAVRRAKEAVLGALPMTEVSNLATATVSRQGGGFGLPEFSLELRGHHFTKRLVENVA